MRQGEIIRVLASLGIAAAGAGLALAGAAVTGNLGGSTTIQEINEPSGAGAASSVLSTSGLSVEEIYRLDSPGVVRISAAATAKRSPRSRQALGSGFVIDKAGHILTSDRVVSGGGALQVSFSGNDELNARLVGKDPSTDVAVLQVDAHSRSLSPLPLGDSDTLQVGDPVVAIGNPLSLTRTVTAGIVSAVQRTIDAPDTATEIDRAIQTDAAIGSGNAGGPLIDGRGQVIGVNTPTGGDTASAGLGFAIPIDNVKPVVAELIRNGKVDHVYLGLSALPVTASLARICDLPVKSGLLVQDVTAGSPAGKAGLRAGPTTVVVSGESYRIGGDIIVAADGTPVTSEAEVRDAIQALKPGDRLTLTIWRGGEKKTVRVTLGRPPG
jgi:putative serine protease PepD